MYELSAEEVRDIVLAAVGHLQNRGKRWSAEELADHLNDFEPPEDRDTAPVTAQAVWQAAGELEESAVVRTRTIHYIGAPR